MSEANTLPGLRVRVAPGPTQVALDQGDWRDVQPQNEAGKAGVGQTGFSASRTSWRLES